MTFLDKLLGDPNERVIKKKLRPQVEKINRLEAEFKKIPDQDLRSFTRRFKQELESGKSLDDLLPEAFAVVREAAKRTLGQRHYDVQLIGGMVLHSHGIAEMKTGEGKTLVATLAVYLNALEGKGVHVVTVNDYLARRDAVWMGKIYDFLGLSVGCIQHDKSYVYDSTVIAREPDSQNAWQGDRGNPDDNKEDDKIASTPPRNVSQEYFVDYEHLRPVERRQAYQADITYGTNNEFGFDFLRDNMAGSREQMVQRELNYGIVDEVDSILIDEARTPLIISASDDRPTDMYYKYAQLVLRLKENEDYNIDEKLRSATLTEAGIKRMEGWLGMENIYTEGGIAAAHHIEQALKARTLFQKDKDYVLREGEVIIVDEFTGRLMPGRRYSEGLHQAIEAKEGAVIQRESRTLATITLQNYFRLYNKLAGMTGTAATEAEEFRKIYGLEVFVIPTNKPVARRDLSDKVYKNKKGKYEALAEEIRARNKHGQPILIGTISIEQNEEFSEMLNKAGVTHEILNAKNHEREAEIIAQAGRARAVTLATNMAGRGVDIVLGGSPYNQQSADEVRQLGGLHVLGTERHEARRIDNQLRGRAGRQGDPGSSQFFVSMDDDLMRIFGSDRVKGLMNRLGVPDDMPIENKLVSRSIESSQKKVEGHNFDIRKHLVEYDDVMNRHREAIYRKRRQIINISSESMAGEVNGRPKSDKGGRGAGEESSLRDIIFEYVEREIMQVVNIHTVGANYQDWNLPEIEQTMRTIFPATSPLPEGGLRGEGEAGGLNLTELIKSKKDRDRGHDAQMRTKLIDHLLKLARDYYDNLIKKIGGESEIKQLERGVLLNSIDTLWMDHLESVDNLRTAIGLQGYGQRDPLVEYKREAYRLFQELQAAIQNQVVYTIFKVVLARHAAQENVMQKMLSSFSGIRFSAPAKTMGEQSEEPAASSLAQNFAAIGQTALNAVAPAANANRYQGEKVGRNDPCPCGSGKKFKKCHGK